MKTSKLIVSLAAFWLLFNFPTASGAKAFRLYGPFVSEGLCHNVGVDIIEAGHQNLDKFWDCVDDSVSHPRPRPHGAQPDFFATPTPDGID